MLRDPPHYLKPLKTTRTPKRLVWLACKGHVRRVRSHYEQHFIAGAAGTTHWTSRNRHRKDTMTAYDNPTELWSFIDSYCTAREKVTLFAYDLAEQMRLSHMLTELPKRGWSLDKIVMERTAAWCSFRDGDRSMMCCDLKSWAPVAWEKITADIDGGEVERRIVTAGRYAMADLCMIKAAYIRAAVMQIFDWIEGENLGPFRPTGSGQSYSAYRRRFGSARLLVHDDESRLDAERRAMHTGRAEAWKHGTLRHGPFIEYDLHAAYATIGRDCEVPTVAKQSRERVPVPTLESMMERYAVLADVTVETDVECVPVTLNGRTLWPVGRLRTTIWDPELRLALQYAKSVEVHKTWCYQREPALSEFCRYVLDGIDGQTQVYGLVPQRVMKHWSRCLVGRFGLRFRMWHQFGDQDPPDVRLVTFLDLDEGTRTEMLLAGSQRLLLGDLEEAPESLPQIPGWIMSECRRRLWDRMTCYGSSLVYVDTDSVIFQDSPKPVRHVDSFTDAYGTIWKRKGIYDRMTIHGPRNLAVNESRRIAGVPLTARPIADLHFEGEVMRSIKESFRDGSLDAVVSLPRTFHLAQKDLRRQHNADGSTSPFHLDMTEGYE